MAHETYYHKIFWHVTGDFTRDGHTVIHLENHPVRLFLIEAQRPQRPEFREFVAYDPVTSRPYTLQTVRLESIK